MTERLLGTDALFWHMEQPGVPIHTIKTAVLDPSALGRPVTLDDVRVAVGPRLGLLPRATQRVQAAPRLPGRPFWVPDRSFDLDAHLDETTLPAPGGRAELDDLHGRLAATPLDRRKPLWALTLVHGLEGGRQAVVVRIHHTVADGLAVMNAFLLVTNERPGASVPTRSPRSPAEDVTPEQLRSEAVRQVPGLVAELGRLAVHGSTSFVRARRFRANHPDLPPFFGSSRTFTSRSTAEGRVCASCDLDFADMRAVARAADVTLNGVYHALVAAAMRDELVIRGEDVSRPTVGAFGIAADTDRTRVSGNQLSTTNVSLFSNVEDPVERLRHTARSCRDGVELRKLTGLRMVGRWTDYTCRLAPFIVRHGASRLRGTVNHITTANVPGPPKRRFAGPVEIVDWISFAIAVPPVLVNVTGYSYAGRMSVGIVAAPDVLPEPRRFLDRMAEEVRILKGLLVASPQPS